MEVFFFYEFSWYLCTVQVYFMYVDKMNVLLLIFHSSHTSIFTCLSQHLLQHRPRTDGSGRLSIQYKLGWQYMVGAVLLEPPTGVFIKLLDKLRNKEDIGYLPTWLTAGRNVFTFFLLMKYCIIWILVYYTGT